MACRVEWARPAPPLDPSFCTYLARLTMGCVFTALKSEAGPITEASDPEKNVISGLLRLLACAWTVGISIETYMGVRCSRLMTWENGIAGPGVEEDEMGGDKSCGRSFKAGKFKNFEKD